MALLPKAGNEQLISELDAGMLEALDAALARQETQAINRIGEQQEERGFFRSGNTTRRVVEEVLGPGIENRRGALLGLAKESALRGREERLGDVGFQRERQLRGEDFERRLTEIDRMAQMQKDLLELQDELSGGGLGDFLGGLVGTGLGGMFGGFGGAVGGHFGAGLFKKR